VLYTFFFSSRRRHTRSYGDWSSDVCSSDLSSLYCSSLPGSDPQQQYNEEAQRDWPCVYGQHILPASQKQARRVEGLWITASQARSEERRVGKGGRWRGAREEYKMKGERWES